MVYYKKRNKQSLQKTLNEIIVRIHKLADCLTPSVLESTKN